MLPRFAPFVQFEKRQPDYLELNNVLIKGDSSWRKFTKCSQLIICNFFGARYSHEKIDHCSCLQQETHDSHAHKCSQRPFDTPNMLTIILSRFQTSIVFFLRNILLVKTFLLCFCSSYCYLAFLNIFYRFCISFLTIKGCRSTAESSWFF